MHFNNFALIGLVAPGMAAPLGARNGIDTAVAKPGQRFDNGDLGLAKCQAISCEGPFLDIPDKREALRPAGDEQSFCDAIGGCDGNLETPNKRSPKLSDVEKLPQLSPGEIIGFGPQVGKEIGIGPQVEEEKREAQFAEACVMPYGCNGDPNDGPADFPDLGRLATDEKRSPSDALSINPEDLVHLDPEEICGFKGCGGVVGLGPDPKVVQEEKRDAQYELCVMPYGCNGDPNDGPADFPDLGRLAADEKRPPSDTVSVNPDDLVHLDPEESCGFKGCGGVAGVGPEVVEEEKRDAALYELCVMPYGCNGDPNDGPEDFGIVA